MRGNRLISVALAAMLAVSLTSFAYADGTSVTTLAELKSAFAAAGTYVLGGDIDVTNIGITANITVNGGGHKLTSTETTSNSAIYQNENVNSVFNNVVFAGNTKPEVGIWEGCGTMTLTDSTVSGYSVSTVRQAAIGVGSSGSGKRGTLTLNNVTFSGNTNYDINISDSATVNINLGTTLTRLRLQSTTANLNIGANWNGSFEITMDSPSNRTLGTVGAGADVSGITVANDGYTVSNDNGNLVVSNENGAELHFDMNQRSTLYHGSTGFLYGTSEINVPSIDLLQGLKPKVMVQKALGGLQHPTGDAIRTLSSNLAGGAQQIQVYLQDIYLEWPYNAPFKSDGSLDVDGYIKTVEEILYGMICDKASESDAGAFLGSDGNYYKLNETEAARYSYVLFNEPDNIWYRNNLSGLEAAFKKVYDAVHAIDPNAKCAGPNFAGFNASSYDSFLSYCKTNNCLPEIITWHELGDASMTAFFSNYNSVVTSMNKYYDDTNKPQLLVNEYARHYDIGAPGGLVKWLSMFEDKDMDGCMAYWAMANSLNEMAADQNSPAASWWVYHWYAQMTGEQCALTAPAFADTRFYGVTSYDSDIKMAYALFGGSEDKHGKETVYLDNMDKTQLVGANGAANVKIYGVSFSGQVGTCYKPEVVFDGAVSVTGNTLKLQLTDTDEMDAFFAVVTPTDETGAQMSETKITTLSYEAEDATLLGGAKAYDKVGWSTFAASGRKEVGSINNTGDGVKFAVNVPEDGTYDIGLFYSLQAPYVNAQTLKPDNGGQNRAIGQVLPFGVQIDNGDKQTIYLDTTVTWNYRRHYNFDANLTAGEHTITFTQIIEDQGSKGNLQLSAAVDKLDLDLVKDASKRYDFEIDLTEHTAFKNDGITKVTAVAPVEGYYNITGDADFTLTKQAVDYAPDAKTYSRASVKDIAVEKTVYLAKGANTLGVSGSAKKLSLAYDAEKTAAAKTVVTSDKMTIHGTTPYYKERTYSESGSVITELGIGQNAADTDKGEDNYVEFKLTAPSAGAYNMAIRYANDEPAPVMKKTDGSTYVHPYNIDLVERYAQIKVNDSEPETVYFRNTMSWDTYKTMDIQLQLDAGENTIKIYNDNSYQFSELVNSTAPEIDTISVAKLSYNGEKVTASQDEGEVDRTKLDAIIAEAELKLKQTDEYSEKTLAALKTAVDSAKSGALTTQSDVNEAYLLIKDALEALRPAGLDLSDYYVTSYSSGVAGTPENSFDGDTSTVWVANRNGSPYVAYEVFDAGEGNVFNLSEITMQGDSTAKVMYLGTNSDNILKTPSELGNTQSDLASKDANLYKAFASLYSADILGTGAGENAVTELSGKYRYLIVAGTTWSVTNIKELNLSAVVENENGAAAAISIERTENGAYADFKIKYNNTGKTLRVYLAAYDKTTNALATVKTEEVNGDFSKLEITDAGNDYIYKAFVWDEDMKPI